MAASIAALTAGGGGLQSTSDASGNLNLVSGTTTIVALTSAGIAVTGTLTASGTTTLVTPVLGTPASADFTTIAATQAQQETGTALTAPVTPGRQQFHSSAAKAWAFVDFTGATPTLMTSYNVSSITDLGAGNIRFTMTTSFSSTSWSALLSASQEGVGPGISQWYETPTVGSVDSYCVNASSPGTAADPGALYFAAFGDQ